MPPIVENPTYTCEAIDYHNDNRNRYQTDCHSSDGEWQTSVREWQPYVSHGQTCDRSVATSDNDMQPYDDRMSTSDNHMQTYDRTERTSDNDWQTYDRAEQTYNFNWQISEGHWQTYDNRWQSPGESWQPGNYENYCLCGWFQCYHQTVPLVVRFIYFLRFFLHCFCRIIFAFVSSNVN